MTNLAGNRIAEFDTSKYGEVYHKHSLWRGSASPNPRSLREIFDGRASHIGVVTADPSTDITRIELVPGVFFTEDVIGAVLRATNSEAAATAVVASLDPFGVYIEFDDPNGAVADVINSDGQFVIFDNRLTDYTGYPTTGGTWTNVELTSDPQFGDLTILTSGGELFAEFMVGWQVQVNAAVPVYLDIVTTTGDGICVSGDVSALVTANETEFCIIHPVGVNPQNGATQTDPCQPESRYLWGGGYYLPPIVGFEMWHDFVFGIHGAQPGENKSGQHYMWNRIYDINMGRWTTTDPATSNANLFDYVRTAPLGRRDPSGLEEEDWKQIAKDMGSAPSAADRAAARIKFLESRGKRVSISGHTYTHKFKQSGKLEALNTPEDWARLMAPTGSDYSYTDGVCIVHVTHNVWWSDERRVAATETTRQLSGSKDVEGQGFEKTIFPQWIDPLGPDPISVTLEGIDEGFSQSLKGLKAGEFWSDEYTMLDKGTFEVSWDLTIHMKRVRVFAGTTLHSTRTEHWDCCGIEFSVRTEWAHRYEKIFRHTEWEASGSVTVRALANAALVGVDPKDTYAKYIDKVPGTPNG